MQANRGAARVLRNSDHVAPEAKTALLDEVLSSWIRVCQILVISISSACRSEKGHVRGHLIHHGRLGRDRGAARPMGRDHDLHSSTTWCPGFKTISSRRKWESPQTRVGGNGRRSMAREPPKTPCSRPLLRPRDYTRQAHAPTVPRASGVKTSTAWTPPSRRGRKAHNCSLSGRTDRRVTRQGRSAGGGRAQRVDTPVGPQLPRPYTAAGHRPALGRSCRSTSVLSRSSVIGRCCRRSRTAPKPTHTNLRRAENGRTLVQPHQDSSDRVE